MLELPSELSQAVALFYDGENAPSVTASGEGVVADDIIAIAQACEVPICENPSLAKLLRQLELGDEIPRELYIAVAHIIAFAYGLGRED